MLEQNNLLELLHLRNLLHIFGQKTQTQTRSASLAENLKRKRLRLAKNLKRKRLRLRKNTKRKPATHQANTQIEPTQLLG